MTKLKYVLLSVALLGCFASCKNNDSFDADAQLKADTTAIRAFITANKIPALKDKSGVFYQIIEKGVGSTTYTASTQVSASYVGRLLGGKVFEDSKGEAIKFPLGGVIAGWQIGIPYIQKGGVIRLLIPSYYAYGPNGQGSIAPNSVLDFTVTLSDVN